MATIPAGKRDTRKAMRLIAMATTLGSAAILGSFVGSAVSRASTPITVNWYYPETNTSIAPNLGQIQNAVNKISVPKIGVRINLEPINSGDYAQKLGVMLETGEANGIVWTSNWLLPFSTEVNAHAFLPLNHLLAADGTALERKIGRKFLRGTSVGGKIYGIPSIQNEVRTAQLGGQIKAALVKTLPFPLKLHKVKPYGYYTSPNIQNYSQLGRFLLAVHRKYPKLIPLLLSNGGSTFDSTLYGYWTVIPNGWQQNNPNFPFFIRIQKTYGNTPPKIVLALQAQKQFIRMLHHWYSEGLINHNAGSINTTEATAISSIGGSVMGGEWPVPDWNPSQATVLPGYLSLEFPLRQGPLAGKYEFIGDATTVNAISATCSHPVQALRFLQLVNTDPAVYNLLSYGIQGVDYTVTDSNEIAFTKAGRDFANDNWVFGDVFSGYIPFRVPGFTWQLDTKINREGITSPAVGFNFNPTPVETQVADMSQVASRWDQPLFNGVYPVSKFAQYEQQMRAAGQQQVLEAVQKQFDQWWKQTHK